ncbi:DeoR/GlpR family DNA-binding transcription regulator [Phenylobacterium sp.]|uniref:DeoR/GlpR family DNA-binding transcription regulator n=1 Tax=Phenylobacterium sp. TaxID=1871053 RepID=UPI0035B0A979
MTQLDRLAEILDLLQSRGACAIGELALKFGVSEETIRRDVRRLEASGRAYKVHGGVRLPDNLFEAPYQIRMNENAEAKRRVAAQAVRLVEDGMTVMMDSGSTTFWTAKALVRPRNLTIVTNSLEVAREVLGRDNNRLFFAGGEVNVDHRAAFGADAVAFAGRFVPDIAYLSIGAIDAERGFLDFHVDEAQFKRSLLADARRVAVVADHSKFGRVGAVHTASFAQVDDLIVDEEPPADIRAAAEAAGVRVHVAG